MTRQLRLKLRRPVSFAREDFVRGPSNAQARLALDAWPTWPGGALALFGPAGVGKSHLARGWAAAAGAVVLDRRSPDIGSAAGRPVLLEDVDESPHRLDRTLTTLVRSGWLDGCAGVVLGGFTRCGDPDVVRAVLRLRSWNWSERLSLLAIATRWARPATAT